MVIVYHIGEPHKVEKKVKVHVCEVSYVNSQGKAKHKTVRCKANGTPYAKGYKSRDARTFEEAKSKVKHKKRVDSEAHEAWHRQNAAGGNESLRDVRHRQRLQERIRARGLVEV